VPIQAQGSYDDFEKWWSDYKSKTEYFRTQDQDLTVVRNKFSADGLIAYKTCIHGGFGVSAFMTTNGNQAIVEVSWRPAPPPPGGTIPSEEKINLKKTEGSGPESITQENVVINGSFTKAYPLTVGVPSTLIAELPGSEAATVSALLPKVFQCWIEDPTVTILHPNNPLLVDAHERTNKYLDAHNAATVSRWAKELEEQGKKNVKVWIASEWEDDSQGNLAQRIVGQKWRYYYAALAASYGGEKSYGQDPRCKQDEPQYPTGQATK